MWFFYALASALIYSIRSILEKKYIQQIDKFVLALGIRFFALPFFIIPLLINKSYIVNVQELSSSFWLAIIYISFISTPIEMILFYKALKKEEVSTLVPFLALSPIITILINGLIFGELPTVWGFAGILLIIFGIYLLNTRRSKGGLLGPFKYIANNSALRIMFIMMLFNASSTVIDKVGIKGANVYFYAFINYVFVSFALFVLVLLKAKKQLNQLKVFFKPLMVIGFIVATYTLLRFIALDQANVSYVSAIMGTSFFFTIIWGILILKEKETRLKLIVGAIITLGLILIKVLG